MLSRFLTPKVAEAGDRFARGILEKQKLLILTNDEMVTEFFSIG